MNKTPSNVPHNYRWSEKHQGWVHEDFIPNRKFVQMAITQGNNILALDSYGQLWFGKMNGKDWEKIALPPEMDAA